MTNALKSVSICLALAALAACADDHPPPPGRGGFGEGRRGGPGGPGGAARLFISPAGKPFRAGPDEPYPVAAWFAQADADRDGRLTLVEFEADAAAFFRQLDQNGDGIVAGPEVTFYEEKLVPEILGGGRDAALEQSPLFQLAQYGGGDGGGMGGGRRGGGGGRRGGGQGGPGARGPGGGGGRGAAPFGLLGEPEPVTAADTDLDFRITAKEFKDAADRRFALLDPMGAGYLTLAGLPKTQVQQMGGRGRGRRGSAPA